MGEWAVDLRPKSIDNMVGQDINKEIINGWIAAKKLPNAVIFYGRSGTGKALKNGTKVLTEQGYKAIEELHIGDRVASNDGKFYNVTGVYPQGKKECYEVDLGHGHIIITSGEHIWTVSRDYGKTFHDETTEEILKKGYTYTEKGTGWTHHEVILPSVQAVEFKEKQLPIDPYLLGAFIGDGTLQEDSVSFSSADQFVIDKVNELLTRDWDCHLSKVNSSRQGDVDYHVVSNVLRTSSSRYLREAFKELGLLVTAKDKFIPEQYLFSSIEQRRALLAGLLDTDGYIDKTGISEYTSVSEKLIQQIEFLAESLGIVTKSKYNIPSWYTVKGSTERIMTKPASSIRFYTLDILCTLPRRVERERNKSRRTVKNLIRVFDIKPVGSHECTCISIDAPSHLYLTEHFIPTHNTTSSRALAKAFDAELIEFDAASHNGVDDARQVNEQASRLSLTGKRKIFLIDECFPAGTQVTTDTTKKSIEEIKVGDKVKSLIGTSEVEAVFTKQVKADKLITAVTTNGNITATKEHLFLTNRGWIQAQNLKLDDTLYDTTILYDFEDREYSELKHLVKQYIINVLDDNRVPENIQKAINHFIEIFTKNSDRDTALDFTAQLILSNFGFDVNIRDKKSFILKAFSWYSTIITDKIWNTGKGIESKIPAVQNLLELLSEARIYTDTLNSFRVIKLEEYKSNKDFIEVYDLQVKGHPSYFVNDTLVHNCHMLSVAAWNTLLKAIEEPNELVTFIFATTDYSKLPATIRGRSRMLKFYSITDADLTEYAHAVLEHQGYTLKEEVIELIVKQARGQVRDLLKLLQTVCEGGLDDITKVKKLLAIPDSKGMRSFIASVLNHNPRSGIKIIKGIETDLLEWVVAVQEHIYEILEDKYKVKEFFCGDNATLRQQITDFETKFTDKQFGLLLTELNRIRNADTAFAQLYALLFRGVD